MSEVKSTIWTCDHCGKTETRTHAGLSGPVAPATWTVLMGAYDGDYCSPECITAHCVGQEQSS